MNLMSLVSPVALVTLMTLVSQEALVALVVPEILVRPMDLVALGVGPGDPSEISDPSEL